MRGESAKKWRLKRGMTLVEILVAVLLVGVAASMVYSSGFHSYRLLMRSRMRLEAQGIAFDTLWQLFNMPYQNLPAEVLLGSHPIPPGGVLPTSGLVRFSIAPETNPPLHFIEYWEITVQVWPEEDSPLFSVFNADGTLRAGPQAPLAEYRILRYRGDR